MTPHRPAVRSFALAVFAAFIISVSAASLVAQVNAVPFVNQPLVPTSAAPGSTSLTLTVNGAGFVPASVVNWNGTPLSTTYVGVNQVQATVPSSALAAASTASVTVSSPGPGGGTSNVVPFTVSVATDSLSFAKSTIRVGDNPGDVVVADFNNDGKADLAIINQNQPDSRCYHYGGVGTISVFLGNGDGTFSAKSTLCFFDGFGTTALPQLVAGDFNGDGKVDLVAGYLAFGASSLQFFMGNGDGTFTGSGIDAAFDGSFQTVIDGDFNQDGKLDLAFPAYGGDEPLIIALLGNGDGTFPSASGYGPLAGVSLATGDFNRDGILDLAVSDGQDSLAILLGNGNGSFTPAATQPAATGNVTAVTAGDFNGDGILDLALAGSSTLTILQGNGDGTFTPLSGEPSIPQSSFVTTSDLNGDGKLDLVFCAANAISILLGNGDGTFQSGVSYAVGSGPFAVGVGDFNGDGRLDLAVTNSSSNTVSILSQTVAAPKVAVTLAAGQGPIYVNEPATFTAAVSAKPFFPTGSVTFKQGGTILGTVPLVNGQASLTTVLAKAGVLSITANYSGDQNYHGASSRPVQQVVNKYLTSIVLTSTPNPAGQGQAVSFTATVSSPGPTPTGRVQFVSGGASLGSAIVGNSVATITKSNLPPGTLRVTATYYGDAASDGTTSQVLQQVVN